MDTNRRLAVVSAAALWGWLSLSGGTLALAASNLVTPDSYQLVSRAEQMFFGKTDNQNTFQRRLELLEVGIFGRVRSGSQEKRFGRIADALGIDLDNLQNSQSSPPRATAPGSTSSGSITQTPTPPGTDMPKIPGAGNPVFPELTDSGRKLPDIPSLELEHHPELKAQEAATAPSSAPGPQPARNKIASSPAKSGAAPATKPRVVLSKETPREEAVASTNASPAGRRVERPSVNTVKDIAEARTKELEDLFRKGMSEFRDKHFGEAQICFKKILTIDPRNVDAYYNLGSMAEAKKDYVDALTYYRAALVSKPTDKDLKSAVQAMEVQLQKQGGKTATSTDHHSSNAGTARQHKTGIDSGSRVANAPTNSDELFDGTRPAPVSEVTMSDAPNVPVEQFDAKSFSLQTAQNGLNNQLYPMNGINAPYQRVPIYGVPATLNVNGTANGVPIGNVTPTTKNRGAFNSILRMGSGYALRGTGLHCPICQVLGGLH